LPVDTDTTFDPAGLEKAIKAKDDMKKRMIDLENELKDKVAKRDAF
jgi:hypothetical protein